MVTQTLLFWLSVKVAVLPEIVGVIPKLSGLTEMEVMFPLKFVIFTLAELLTAKVVKLTLGLVPLCQAVTEDLLNW